MRASVEREREASATGVLARGKNLFGFGWIYIRGAYEVRSVNLCCAGYGFSFS